MLTETPDGTVLQVHELQVPAEFQAVHVHVICYMFYLEYVVVYRYSYVSLASHTFDLHYQQQQQ